MKVVFDLDGTLCDVSKSAQKHLVDAKHKTGKKDWEGFHRAIINDPPILPTLNTMKTFLMGGHCVEIWTGRSMSLFDETGAWLYKHTEYWGLPDFYIPLRMRAQGDKTDDHAMKRAWAEEFGKPDAVFEDRQRVVDMWRSIGVTCYQVDNGKF